MLGVVLTAWLALVATGTQGPSSFSAAQGPARVAESFAARQQARLCLDLRGEEGVEACRQALTLGLSPARRTFILRVLALKLAALERWDEMVEVYREAVRLTPEDPEAHLRLGTALLHALHRPEEAEPHLRRAVELAPGEARARGEWGVALNALGRHAEAVAALEEAFRLDPDYFENRPAARGVRDAASRGEKWP